jgi:class 3 adenylate cyclase/HAMP domain-containing protein
MSGRKISLASSIGAAFALALIPTILVVINFTYSASKKNLQQLSNYYSERSGRDAIAAVTALLEPVGNTLRTTAELAALEPGFFRSERSRDYLQKALISAEQFDSVYTSFEDGYHRVVTRVDDYRRRNDPKIPAEANWHSSWIPAGPQGRSRVRHRKFFDVWPRLIKSYDVVTDHDVRNQPQYMGAKATGKLFVNDPMINPDTGGPVIALSHPVLKDGRFVGAVSANITFGVLARHLDDHKVTEHSLTLILDGDGRVLAHPDPSKGVTRTEEGMRFADAATFPDQAVRDAFLHRQNGGGARLLYVSGDGRTEHVASFTPFPESFAKKWEVLTITPTDDFLGPLKATNRRLLLLMTLLVFVELLLIFAIAGRLAAPINNLSIEMQSLRNLQFSAPKPRDSPIREVARLEKAVTLLQHSLKSFGAFVPIGVVRQLVTTGKPINQHVESKELTVLFTDLAGFTHASEQLKPKELSELLTVYFEESSVAIRSEGGTIDKFIGDSVMAFWGAPSRIEHQAERACCAALRIARRIDKLNEWAADPRHKLKVRIGLHHGQALVGNIGSTDRLSYTAIGDTVNVAARLEGLNKDYGTTICLSEDLYAEVKSKVVVKALGTVKVRGRERALKVYELLGMKHSDDPELQPAAEKA